MSKPLAGKGAMIPTFWIKSMASNRDEPPFQLAAIAITVGPTALEQSQPLIGMLDTGADLCRIDQSVAEELAMGGTMPSSLAGATATSEMRHGVIKVPGLDFQISGEFPIGTYRASGQCFDVLLGQDFLRHFHLEMHGRTRRTKLKFLGVA